MTAVEWLERMCGQALVVRGYGNIAPFMGMPLRGVFLATLVQVCLEDRGIMSSVRDSRIAAATPAQRTGDSFGCNA